MLSKRMAERLPAGRCEENDDTVLVLWTLPRSLFVMFMIAMVRPMHRERKECENYHHVH